MRATTVLLQTVLFIAIMSCALAHWAQLEPEMMLQHEQNRMPADDYSHAYPYKIPVDDFPTERSITGYVGGSDKYDEISFSVSPAFANTSGAMLSIFPLVWGCDQYKNRYIDAAIIGPCDGRKFVPMTLKQAKSYPFKDNINVNTECVYLLIQEKGNNRGILNEGYSNNTFYYPNNINSACIRTRPAPVCTGMNNVVYRYQISVPGDYRIVHWEKQNRKVDYSMALGVRGSGRSSNPEHQIYTHLINKAYSVLTFNNKRARVRCPYNEISHEWGLYVNDENDPDLTKCVEQA